MLDISNPLIRLSGISHPTRKFHWIISNIGYRKRWKKQISCIKSNMALSRIAPKPGNRSETERRPAVAPVISAGPKSSPHMAEQEVPLERFLLRADRRPAEARSP
jgi:hypothetical protein